MVDIKNLYEIGRKLQELHSLLWADADDLFKLSLCFWASWPFFEMSVYKDGISTSTDQYHWFIPFSKIHKLRISRDMMSFWVVNVLHEEPSAPTRITFLLRNFDLEEFRNLVPGVSIEVEK